MSRFRGSWLDKNCEWSTCLCVQPSRTMKTGVLGKKHGIFIQDKLKTIMVIHILAYCLFGVNYFFKLGSKIEASEPPRNDLIVVSIIEMTYLHGARGSFVLLRPKY